MTQSQLQLHTRNKLYNLHFFAWLHSHVAPETPCLMMPLSHDGKALCFWMWAEEKNLLYSQRFWLYWGREEIESRFYYVITSIGTCMKWRAWAWGQRWSGKQFCLLTDALIKKTSHLTKPSGSLIGNNAGGWSRGRWSCMF